MRFGIVNAKIKIPKELKNKLKATQMHQEREIRKITQDVEKARKIKILANILRVLIKSYEEKNKLKINKK